jgi:predicted  nucleic acid-binding Zn-ribbon protein
MRTTRPPADHLGFAARTRSNPEVVVVVTAAAQDQWRLLDVQAHDTKLAQLAHRQRTLPEHEQVKQLTARLAEVRDELVKARTTATDIGRELVKAEADVEQVRSRARRDQQRLDSGSGSPKDLSALQHEIEALAARQAVLEDAELEVMERQETAEATVAAVTAEQERVAAELAAAQTRLDESTAAIGEESAKEQAARESAAAGVPAELLALYERVRKNAGGVGAARLYQRRCEGCRLELPPNDLSRIRTAAENEVVRCEECGRILVRAPDSGL